MQKKKRGGQHIPCYYIIGLNYSLIRKELLGPLLDYYLTQQGFEQKK